MALDRYSYPFTAIVGQDEMKLALVLNAINPTIGSADPGRKGHRKVNRGPGARPPPAGTEGGRRLSLRLPPGGPRRLVSGLPRTCSVGLAPVNHAPHAR